MTKEIEEKVRAVYGNPESPENNEILTWAIQRGIRELPAGLTRLKIGLDASIVFLEHVPKPGLTKTGLNADTELLKQTHKFRAILVQQAMKRNEERISTLDAFGGI